MPTLHRNVATALAVPPWLLNAWAYVGFIPLAVGGMTETPWLGWIAAAFGIGLLLAGARALILPSRPFEDHLAFMRSSRSVGAFYVLAGAIWTALALGIALG